MPKLSRLLIVEGPDGAGKSTAVKSFTELYKKSGQFKTVNVVHHGPYKGEEKLAAKYFGPMAECLMNPDSALIMDRSWLSEPIYDRVLQRGGSRISKEEDRMLSRVALGLDVSVVLCLPPLYECLLNRPEDAAWLSEVHGEYLLVTKNQNLWPHLPTPIWFDYTIDPFPTPFVEYRNRGPGVGRYQPDTILMVGDRPNTAVQGSLKHRAPFVSFGRRDGCSWWLANQLDAIEYPETSLYWVNAYDCLCVPTPKSFLLDLEPRAVILLGREAIEWFELGLDVSRRNGLIFKVHHPMYQKRFRSFERYNLLQILEVNK